MESSSEYADSILNAIDHLRKRKARPNMGRISRLMARKHGLSPCAVELEIGRLIIEGKVDRVEYKGSVSYRNLSKKLNRTPFCQVLATDAPNTANAITDTTDLYSVLSYGAENKIVIRGCANRENLAKCLIDGRQISHNIIPALNNVEKNSRGQPRKIIPKPDNYVVPQPVNAGFKPKTKYRRKIGRPRTRSLVDVGNLAVDKCDFCLLTAECNKSGFPEDLLKCKDCGARAHPSCMDYGEELAARSRLYPWQCNNCKSCSICEGLRDPELMLFCDFCDKGYHMDCHEPVVYEKPLGKWKCRNCETVQNVPLDRTVVLESCTATKDAPIVLGDFSHSQNGVQIQARSKPKKFLNGYPDDVPNASLWTIEDVKEFIVTAGFPEQALAFKEQEIDGKSLLLMKRSDVLTGLSIKLGPALKIYNHIKRLQMGKCTS